MDTPISSPMRDLLNLLDRLEKDNIWYQLMHVRDSIMVVVNVPGYRWEVEFFEDGEIEIERFASMGVVSGDHELLERLLKEQEDADNAT